MDVLQLFTIANAATPDRAQLSVAFLPVKTWNVERAQHSVRPGTVPSASAASQDNADIAGPDSAYDRYA